jgi:hypothetical protein
MSMYVHISKQNPQMTVGRRWSGKQKAVRTVRTLLGGIIFVSLVWLAAALNVPDTLLSSSQLASVVGECDDGGANQCYFIARRHGCSFYNYPCATAPVTCDPAVPVPQECTDASCNAGSEGQKCDLEKVETTYNICKTTGDKNALECLEGEERCTLDFLVKWKETNPSHPNTQTICIEKGGDQCKSDPTYKRVPLPKCSPK